MNSSIATGFAPIAQEDARVLILGTAPSQKSLATNQYYGHPQNAFWRIMGDLFQAGPELAYKKRQTMLLKNTVAVWDVLQSCERPGSMDADIDPTTLVPNNFQAFFDAHPNILSVFFNGRKAEELFVRHVHSSLNPESWCGLSVVLPSTSPAYASMSYTEKLRTWSVVCRDL
jgi:TDG/mug DNA glycosylase family protein